MNSVTAQGRSPLLYAASKNHPEIVRLARLVIRIRMKEVLIYMEYKCFLNFRGMIRM